LWRSETQEAASRGKEPALEEVGVDRDTEPEKPAIKPKMATPKHEKRPKPRAPEQIGFEFDD
jgi:hypothetical protein